MLDEKLVERVERDIGPYFQKRWASLQDHSLVGEARSVGLIAGLEMVKDKSRREKFRTTIRAGLFFRDAAFRNGLVLRAIGDTVVASPLLVITHAEVDELIGKLGRTLDETERYARSL